ncbi:hypothetical protein DESACE_06380 [Desulfurella acetivorans A63]|nr:hypothetical protein DESACE_06380 [Desulfurella acetivorans A63]
MRKNFEDKIVETLIDHFCGLKKDISILERQFQHNTFFNRLKNKRNQLNTVFFKIIVKRLFLVSLLKKFHDYD